MHKQNVIKILGKLRHPHVVALIVFIYYATTRLWPIWKYGPLAFGYDTGIYRHYIQGYASNYFNFKLNPFGFSFFSNVLNFFQFSTEEIMYGWYFIISCLIFWLFYLVISRYFSQKVAIVGIILFSLSITQFEFYWWYYYRNFLALFFLLFFLLLYYYESYLVILPLLIIGTIHPISLLPLGLAFLFILIFDKTKRKFLLMTGFLSVLGILILNWQEMFSYISLFKEKNILINFPKEQIGEFNGQFIDIWFYLRSSVLYLIFGLIGVIQYRQKKIFAFFFLTTLLLISSKIVFYRRFYVYIDLALIIFAASFLAEIIQNIKNSWIGRLTVFVYLVFFVFNSIGFVYNKQPLISDHEFVTINNINQSYKDKYVISLSSYYAPWLYGFTESKIIAPGMLDHNLWNEEKWNKFWLSEDKNLRYQLIEEYQEPRIYVFTGQRDVLFEQKILNDPHFKKIGDYLWEYNI